MNDDKHRELFERIAAYCNNPDELPELIAGAGFVLVPIENILNVANVGREMQAAIRVAQRAKDVAIVRKRKENSNGLAAWDAELEEIAKEIENQTDD